jgi:hypothetical protein
VAQDLGDGRNKPLERVESTIRGTWYLLENSTNFGGLRCFAGLCSEYVRNNTRRSRCKHGETWT